MSSREQLSGNLSSSDLASCFAVMTALNQFQDWSEQMWHRHSCLCLVSFLISSAQARVPVPQNPMAVQADPETGPSISCLLRVILSPRTLAAHAPTPDSFVRIFAYGYRTKDSRSALVP